MEKIRHVQWSRALVWIPMLILGTTSLFANTQQNTRRAIRATWVENPPAIDGDITDTVGNTPTSRPISSEQRREKHIRLN